MRSIFMRRLATRGRRTSAPIAEPRSILWPRDRLLAVINQAGLGVTLPFLADLADRWAANGDSATLDQARVLSEHMLSGWPKGEWYPRRDNELTDGGRFLNLLRRLKDASGLEAFLIAIAGRRGFDIGDCAAIAGALRALPPDRAAPLATSLIEGAAEPALGACANLLARLSTSNPALAIGAARALVDSPAWRSGARFCDPDLAAWARRSGGFHRRSFHRARTHRYDAGRCLGRPCSQVAGNIRFRYRPDSGDGRAAGLAGDGRSGGGATVA